MKVLNEVMISYVVVLAPWKRLLSLLRHVLIAVIVLSLNSCRTPLQTVSSQSIRVSESLRDTTYIIEADSSLLRALIACDSAGRAYLAKIVEIQSGKSIPPATISIDTNNILSVKSKIPQIKVDLKTKIVTETSEKLITNTHIVNKMNNWQIFWCRLGQISLLAILIFLFIKFLFK